MANTQPEIQDAISARELTSRSQENGVAKALGRISNMAVMGHSEVVLHDVGLSMEGAHELMRLGFSVAEILHPFEQAKRYKISW